MTDNVDFDFATGEASQLVRALIERLSRNGDRIVIVRATTMNVITASFLQNDDRESWAKTLSTFVWVNGSQLVASEKRDGVTCSGSRRCSKTIRRPVALALGGMALHAVGLPCVLRAVQGFAQSHRADANS
ncbi:MAG TPA: hypothetical protein VEK79_01435 [Thermoanaerobaculia bacterium]|nr:hypothetical protein [Thermoanaerobaculia bacterium]